MDRVWRESRRQKDQSKSCQTNEGEDEGKAEGKGERKAEGKGEGKGEEKGEGKGEGKDKRKDENKEKEKNGVVILRDKSHGKMDQLEVVKEETNVVSKSKRIPIDYLPATAILTDGKISSFNGIELPRPYAEVDDCRFIECDKLKMMILIRELSHRPNRQNISESQLALLLQIHGYLHVSHFIHYKFRYIQLFNNDYRTALFRRPFFPDPKPKREHMLAKLDDGVDPSSSTSSLTIMCESSSVLAEDEFPFTPRCLPVKGALQCVEEYPKFSAECIDQFIHKRDVNFEQIEEYWIRNPLSDEDDNCEGISETEVG